MTSSPHSSSKIQAHNRLALSVANAKGQLAVRVVDEMYKNPFWMDRFAARGRRHSEEDLGYHVDYLVQSLTARDAGVMERYARWLQNVLTTRGMCTFHLADSFTHLDREIRQTVPDAEEVETYFDAAKGALLYPAGSPARAVQDAAPALAPAVARRMHSRFATRPESALHEDVVYYVAYLADAIALEQPRVFTGYITWLKGFLTRHESAGLTNDVVIETVHDVDRELDVALTDAQAHARTRDVIAEVA